MLDRLAGLIRGMERKGAGYSRGLRAARLRASYQRAYFAPARAVEQRHAEAAAP